MLLIFLTVHNGEGQSSHVPVFCVNFERHICTHITTSIKCYLIIYYITSGHEVAWGFSRPILNNKNMQIRKHEETELRRAS